LTDNGPDQRLTIGEAAALLGTSRLRVRGALAAGVLSGYRNNQGQWLVDLDTMPASLDGSESGSLPPERLLELLFDEVEELQQTIDERDGTIAQLTALMERQGAALEQAVALAERGSADGHAAALDALSATSARALDLLEGAIDRLAEKDAVADDLSALVERGLATSEQLDTHLRTQQEQLAENQEVIAHQGRMIDRLFTLSEKVLGLVRLPANRNNGLLSRIFNRSGDRR